MASSRTLAVGLLVITVLYGLLTVAFVAVAATLPGLGGVAPDLVEAWGLLGVLVLVLDCVAVLTIGASLLDRL